MTKVEKFNPFDDMKQFANNPADFIQDKAADIAKGKLCEVIGAFPVIGPVICEQGEEDNKVGYDKKIQDNVNGMIVGTPLEEPNNQLKEMLKETPLENIGIEPIFLVAGASFLFCIFIFLIIILILYYFLFTDHGNDLIKSLEYTTRWGLKEPNNILKQYEFPIPPPPPPPPVNFVMDSDIIKN